MNTKNKEAIILKSRDDREPVYLTPSSTGKYKLINDKQVAWIKIDDEIDLLKIRSRIEPWLTALFQSEHLSLLIGAGLTYAVRDLSVDETNTKIPFPIPEFRDYQAEINKSVGISEEKEGTNTAQVERKINVANELLLGLKHLYVNGSDENKEKIENLQNEISEFIKEFSETILKLENDIASSDDFYTAFEYLVSFLTSFASRSGTRDRLQIFTTNYDRVLEAGAEVAGLHLLDRFVGNLSPIFRSSRLNLDMHYNPPGIRGEPRYLEGVARFTKLHGSVDWVYADQDIKRVGLPFGAQTIDPFLKALGIQENIFHNLMIYPNAAKDKETTAYPYVELFRDFAASICRPNNSLVSYGYSFGDDHINRVIGDMLTIPSTHLVIISYDDPEGRIMEVYKKFGRPAQITLLIGKPFGELRSLVTYFLPKPAIDRITSRMTELLKARFDTEKGRNGIEDDQNELL